MPPHSLSDRAWLLKGLTASEAGTLTLRGGRLKFATDRPVFDAPLAEMQSVRFPWFYFGAGFSLEVRGVKYRLSLIQPGNTAGGEYASIGDARRKGRRWKAALAGSASA